MRRTCPRIFCLMILVFASTACGAGSPTKNITATATATLTQFVLPPEATPTLTEPPSVNPEGTISSTPALTMEVTDISTLSPATEVSKTAPPAVHPSGPLCNDAIYVADVSIPDGTILLPEKEFTKTWRFKNTGTCRWTTAYAIGFSHGNSMKGHETKLPNSVDPGQTIDVSIDMTAPKENGWYGGWWRLKSEAGSYFGDFVFVSILVSDGRGTNPPPPG